MDKYNIYFVDWKNTQSEHRYKSLCLRYPNVYKINHGDMLADTIRGCALLSSSDFFWVVSSLTDYSNFRFEDYNEDGLEPYMQVFGENTWFCSKQHLRAVPANERYVDAFPDLHFVETDLKQDRLLLDIVYISNGEPLAEKHYQHLLKVAKAGNKIHRISGVNGRTEAYQAAAKSSTTPWFFAVFAKLEVDSNFDWNWYPRQTAGPKHYVFDAHNPVTGLAYGHMAMIAYNREMVLGTKYTGLDFTMTKPHDVVHVNSGIARYDQNPEIVWRTAFRECLKLRSSSNAVDVDRLTTWLAIGQGEYGQWSIAGARDAVDYYQQVGGDFEQLLLSYNWSWLNQYFRQKYNL